MDRKFVRLLTVPALLMAALSSQAQMATNAWTGAGDSDWFNAANWSRAQIPQAGQAVVLDSTYATAFTNILLSNSTPWLSSLEISNRVITFSNWNTLLCATSVTIRSSAVFTLPPPFVNGAMSNRVYVSCSNFTLEAGGKIDVNEKGYLGGPGNGNGPGGGIAASGWSSGGGHGGLGGAPFAGTPAPGAVNGTPSNPNPGSGGGGSVLYGAGGNGGGLVRIDATGALLLNGLITANGGIAYGYPSGGGSGGGVRLDFRVLAAASTGTIQAVGGGGGTVADPKGGRGGGGRIVLRYNPQAQAGAGLPSMRISEAGGLTGPSAMAGIGTIYISDSLFLTPQVLGTNAQVYGVTNWTDTSLTITNCNWMLGSPGVRVQVASTLLVGSNGTLSLHLENSRLDCNRLVLTNGGRLSLYSGPTNGTTPAYGALASVTGDVWIGSNAWFHPWSDPTNGGSLCLRAQNVFLTATNGGVDATGRGFASLKGYGTGVTDASAYGGGGGYGGKGGKGGNTKPAGGSPYGPTNAPIHAGSGGAGSYGGSPAYGGGFVWIEAAERVRADGIIRANGAKGVNSGNGGGSGGGIYILSPRFDGAAGAILEATGGNGQANGGGGGGGRIGIWHGLPHSRLAQAQAGHWANIIISNGCGTYSGSISVTNGTGFLNGPPDGAEVGTVRFVTSLPLSGTLVLIR